MKNIFLTLLLISMAGVAALAQCDKNSNLLSSQTEILNANGEVQKIMAQKTVIGISKTLVSISPEDDAPMQGEIISHECNWKVPYKEGKSVIKASFEKNGEHRGATLTIEGKDGKLSLVARFDQDPEKVIRVWLDKFEERQ